MPHFWEASAMLELQGILWVIATISHGTWPYCWFCRLHNTITNDLIYLFFNYYLAAPRPTLGHYLGGSLTYPMLIPCVLHIRPGGHLEPRTEVVSLSLAERLVEFKPGTFRFWSQRLNPCYKTLFFFAESRHFTFSQNLPFIKNRKETTV